MTKKILPHMVFVYGTLMQGHGNNRVMTGDRGGEAVLLGKATTLQKFYMASGGFPRVAKQTVGGFPASMRPLDCLGQIKGEVWRVSEAALKACDRLEGHPRFYCREVVPVILAKDKTRLRPWMYIIVEPVRPYECMEKDDQGLLEWERPLWRKTYDAVTS